MRLASGGLFFVILATALIAVTFLVVRRKDAQIRCGRPGCSAA